MNSFTLKSNRDTFNGLENIEDIIKCYICLDKIKEPCMCPYCQKLTCEKCIQKWLVEKKNQCPNCRSPLRFSQVIKVSFMTEVANFIDKMNLNKKTEQLETCLKHHIKFLYYCIECKIPLCSDCYMFENDHKNHKIKKIDDVYHEHFNLIRNEKEDLDDKRIKLNKNLKEISDKITEIGNYRYKRMKELDDTFKTLSIQLKTQSQDLIDKLLNWKSNLEDKIKNIDIDTDKLTNEIKNSTKSELIDKSKSIIEKMKKLKDQLNYDKEINKNFNLNLSSEIPNSIIPTYETAIFKVDNFENIKSPEVIYSPELIINGLKWRLKLYPQGNASAKYEYLSIFLELIGKVPEISKYFYILELINFKGKKNFYQEYSSNFSNGECWGYSKFFKLNHLKNDGFIDNQGKIVIKIHIRPESFSQLSRDLKNYIGNLENQINILNNNNDNGNLSNESDDLSFKLSYDKSFKDLNLVKSFLITDEEINNNSEKKSDSLEKIKMKEKIKRNKFRKLTLSTNNKNKNEFFNAPIDNKLFSERDKNKQHKFFISNSDNDNNNYQIFNENNNIMKKKIEFTEEKINNQNNCEKEISNKRISKFQIEMSLDSAEEEDIKQIDEIHDENSIIKQKDNQSMISEDSIGYLMDSLKEIDNKKEKNSSSKVIDSYKKFMNNVKDSIVNNNNKINNNINFGRFYNLGLNSLSNSNINNVKNEQNKYIYGGNYESYKQKYKRIFV